MKTAIIGGGNIGTLMAAEIAYKGHQVTMCTSCPEIWEKKIEVYDPSDRFLFSAELENVTADVKSALQGAEMVWITVPAQLFAEMAREIIPCVEKGQYIGVIPGSGGAEFVFGDVVKKGGILLGLQRVHCIARLKEKGKSVYMLGRKKELKLAAVPENESAGLAKLAERLFDIPCTPLPNYMSVTLTPSNPILHTARLYTMFKDYREGMSYPRNFLFYEEWDDASSEMLIACDRELQKLCEVMPMDLSGVESLCDYYESRTVTAMTQKIKGIPAFKGLLSPMKQQADGSWVPDFENRYFAADFPCGLKIIKDLAAAYHVDTPNIDKVWDWYALTAMAVGLDA